VTGTVRRALLALAVLVVTACSSTDKGSGHSVLAGATAPSTTTATSAAAGPYASMLAAAFDASRFGIPAGTDLQPWRGSYRLSENPGRTETVDGEACDVYDGFDVDFADSGDYVYVDRPCVVFRNSRFRTTASVSNTSALVQQAAANQRLIIEHCDFDGGPLHQRGIQADYADVVVRSSRFVRFGNAGVELDADSGTANLEVTDSYFEETPGWNRDDHVDGIQVGAGHNVTIRDNTVLIAAYGETPGDTDYVSNSALGIWAELGDVTGAVTISHNVLGGGGKVIYLQQKPPYRFAGSVSVSDNVIVRRYSALGGIWGVLEADGLPADLHWERNAFDNGSDIPLKAATAES
jgi:hypothetical protein